MSLHAYLYARQAMRTTGLKFAGSFQTDTKFSVHEPEVLATHPDLNAVLKDAPNSPRGRIFFVCRIKFGEPRTVRPSVDLFHFPPRPFVFGRSQLSSTTFPDDAAN
jgi:hypothetical protein